MRNFTQLLYKTLLEIFRYYRSGRFRSNRDFYFTFALLSTITSFFVAYVLTYFMMSATGDAPHSIYDDFLKPVLHPSYKELFTGILMGFQTALLFSLFEFVYSNKSKGLEFKSESILMIIGQSKGFLSTFTLTTGIYIIHFFYLKYTMNDYTDFMMYDEPIYDIRPVSAMFIKDLLYMMPFMISTLLFYGIYALQKKQFPFSPIVISFLLNAILETIILSASDAINSRMTNILYHLSIDNTLFYYFSFTGIFFVFIWIMIPASFIALLFPVHTHLKKHNDFNGKKFFKEAEDAEILV